MTLDLYHPRTERASVMAIWRALCDETPRSYFLSPGYVEVWLDHLPDSADVRLAVVRRDGEAVAATFLGRSRVVRQHVFRSDAWLLNQTGVWAQDQVYIEDNDFLCRPGASFSLGDFLAQLPGEWDELYLSGIDPQGAAGRLLGGAAEPYDVYVMNRIPAPYVDLAALSASKKDYLAALGSNTRSQVRRCYKLYEERGKLATEIAATTAEALDIFDDLVTLHQHWWGLRGEKGAFANSWFHSFHRSLIERRFETGEMQLLRVRSGEAAVGCIYNFVWNGAVFFYQSGFRPEEDNRLKPGYVCHTEAIRHSIASGLSVYDFMASFDEYKERMATGRRELLWVRVQKPRLKFAVERAARAGALRAIDQYRKAKANRKRPRKAQVAETAC